MKKKLILTMLSIVLLLTMGVMSTLAFLTDRDKVVNVFTVGDVQITLDEAKVTPDGKPVDPEELVSMNFWCFTPDIFVNGDRYFEDFLRSEKKDPLKAECYLPTVVGEMVKEGLCDVSVLETSARWYGVTYQEDKAGVIEKIGEMIRCGEYPDGLWK